MKGQGPGPVNVLWAERKTDPQLKQPPRYACGLMPSEAGQAFIGDAQAKSERRPRAALPSHGGRSKRFADQQHMKVCATY